MNTEKETHDETYHDAVERVHIMVDERQGRRSYHRITATLLCALAIHLLWPIAAAYIVPTFPATRRPLPDPVADL